MKNGLARETVWYGNERTEQLNTKNGAFLTLTCHGPYLELFSTDPDGQICTIPMSQYVIDPNALRILGQKVIGKTTFSVLQRPHNTIRYVKSSVADTDPGPF